MVDIQTISIAIASAGVVAGIVYYAFQVRHQDQNQTNRPNHETAFTGMQQGVCGGISEDFEPEIQ